MKEIICSIVVRIIQLFEWLGIRWPVFGDWYRRLFYERMINAEAEKCGLRPGMKILHIGSGPLPITSISLSLVGFSVVAVDSDPTAIQEARKKVEEMGLCRKIKFLLADGADISSGGFDAVWISLHVQQKEKVLKRAYSELKPGGKIVFRNPRDWLSLIYPRIDMKQVFSGVECSKLRQKIGKETIVIEKPPLDIEMDAASTRVAAN